jgi:hypothetical protein
MVAGQSGEAQWVKHGPNGLESTDTDGQASHDSYVSHHQGPHDADAAHGPGPRAGPDGGGKRIREGVAEDRRVSVEDPEMRHGRKSKSKRFNGYKRPSRWTSNGPHPLRRHHASQPARGGFLGRGGEIVCRPWVPRGKGVFTKAAFKINVRDLTITCPAGETERIVFGAITEFDPEACDRCALRSKCTAAAAGLGLLTRRACPGATGRGGPRAASSRPARPAARRAARTPARRRRRVRGAARPRHRFRTASRPD